MSGWTEVKLKAVRSAGYQGGWKWVATLPGGREVNASHVYWRFKIGDSVSGISHELDLASYWVESILRAMMKRKRR